MKKLLKMVGLAGFSLGLNLSGEVVRASTLGIDPLWQDRLQITEFATGLDFPSGLLQLNDGSMLIGTTTGNGFFDSQSKGQLVRLQDTNGDGFADTKTVLYDGRLAGNNLPGGISAIRAVDNYLFVTSFSKDRISVFQQGANTTDPLTLKGTLDFTFPANRAHATSALAVRQTGAQQFELFFNLGAAGNNQATAPGAISLNSTAFALTAPNLAGDSIYKLPVAVGSTLNLGQPVLVATGLRNAAGLEFDPVTGDLYIGENGIDGLTNPNEPFTADELNRLTLEQLNSADVENFGFPAYGEKYRAPGVFIDGLGQVVNAKDPNVIDALANFQPIPNATTGFESEGLASLAFAPAGFADGLNNGLFVGFFGRFGYQPSDDRENPLVYYDRATNSYSHFLSANRSGGDFGHFTNLFSTQNSLFALDVGAGSGLLFSAAGLGMGKIYQIQAQAQPVPEPSTILGTVVAIGCGAWLKKKARR